MILGIGVDSIEISRVVKAMEKEHFVHRIFTEKERVLLILPGKKR